MSEFLALLVLNEKKIKEAARKLWDGHAFEFDSHWAFSENWRLSGHPTWPLTSYKSLRRRAIWKALFS